MINQEKYILALNNVKGLGEKGLRYIFNTLHSKELYPEDIFYQKRIDDLENLFPEFNSEGKFSRVQLLDFLNIPWKAVENDLNKLEQNNFELLYQLDPLYNNLLKKYNDIDLPPILYLYGNKKLLTGRNIAIVGSRNINQEIGDLTQNIAGELVNKDYSIISGFAKGTDLSAHMGALASGGNSIFVLPQGIFTLSVNKEIKSNINQENSLFLSEFKPRTGWKSTHAMKRNKLIINLSDVVIVVASGLSKDKNGRMSGTYQAALKTLESGKTLFVYNSNHFKEYLEGNQALIKRGGIEFNSANDLCIKLETGVNIQKNQISIKF